MGKKFVGLDGLKHFWQKIKTKIEESQKTVTDEIAKEVTARTNADTSLQTAINGKSDVGHTHDDRYYTESEIDTKLSNKVDKVSGKGLSTNDYTTAEKNKLAGLKNYDDTEVRGLIEDETTRATTAENNLSTSINDVKSSAVTSVNYDSTNKKITKTINGTKSDVVTLATMKTAMALNKVTNVATESTITKDSTKNITSGAVYTLKQTVDSNKSAIDTLNGTGTGSVKKTVTDEIAKEVTARTNADTSLQTAINGKSDVGHTHDDRYYTESEIDTKLSNKVDKVSGKGLSTNDYTTAEKNKLAGLKNYDDTEVRGLIEDETTRATTAENNLSTSINDVKSSAVTSVNYDSTNKKITKTINGTKSDVVTLATMKTAMALNKVTNVATESTITKDSTKNITSGAVYTLKQTVDSNKSAIDTLNGTGTGSVKKTVTDEIAKVVANAPADFDTLKEISDWIDTHEDSASAMNTAISKNATNLSNHTSNKSNPHSVTKAQVGLGNVGNFKAVSTVANQGLTDDEKANARANIGAGMSSFSGSYTDLKNKPTSLKNPNALTVNGKTYDGSSAVNAGVQTIANGGTGQTTANAAANSFINSLVTGSSVPVDNDYFISQYVGGGTTNTTYVRRPMSKLWEYIKGKISSVLGLTATDYSGKASTAGTADKTKNDITMTISRVAQFGQYVIPLGNILEPTSTEVNSPYNWDITGFFSIIRASEHNGSHIKFEAGHGYSNAWRTYAYLDKEDFCNVTTSIKAFQYNGKWWLGLYISTCHQDYVGKMTITYSRGLPATPTCILYNSKSDGVANEEIYNSLQDIPSSWWSPRTIHNPTTFIKDITAPNITSLEESVAGKSDVGHTHTKSEITDFPSIPTKVSELTNDNLYHYGLKLPAPNGKTYYAKIELLDLNMNTTTIAIRGNIYNSTFEIVPDSKCYSRGNYGIEGVYYPFTSKNVKNFVYIKYRGYREVLLQAPVKMTLVEYSTTAPEGITFVAPTVLGYVSSTHKHSASDITSGTLPIAKGGTGATTAKGAEYNITSGMVVIDSDFEDDSRIAGVFIDASTTKGRFYSRTALHLWNYIKNKISSVLGLTATAYSGKASTSGTADKTDAIGYTGTGTSCVTAAQIDSSYFNSVKEWASYLIFNHGNGENYFHQMIRMPFFDGVPQYQKMRDGTLCGWKDFITSENISSQSVAKASTAGTADKADQLNCTTLPNGANLNNYTTPGMYNTSDNVTYVNAPVTNFGLMIIKINGNYIAQILYQYETGFIYTRTTYYDGSKVTWSVWNKMVSESDLTDIKNDILSMSGDITSMKGDITSMKGDIKSMKGDISTIYADITSLNANITSLNSDISSLRNDIKSMRGDITYLYTQINK